MVVESTEKRQVGVDVARVLSAHAAPTADDPSDAIIKQLFSITIELHAALGLVKSQQAVRRIDRAIGELDDVIKSLLNAALDARPERQDR